MYNYSWKRQSDGLTLGFLRIGLKSSSSYLFSLSSCFGGLRAIETSNCCFGGLRAIETSNCCFGGLRAIETSNCWSEPVLLYLCNASKDLCPVLSLISWSVKLLRYSDVAQVTLPECPVFYGLQSQRPCI